MSKNIHIGKLIEDELLRQEHTKVWLAKQIPCNRVNVYNILQREYIDTNTLLRISQILRHDFFKYFSNELHENAEV